MQIFVAFCIVFFVAKENTDCDRFFFCSMHGTADVCGIFTGASMCAGTYQAYMPTTHAHNARRACGEIGLGGHPLDAQHTGATGSRFRHTHVCECPMIASCVIYTHTHTPTHVHTRTRM